MTCIKCGGKTSVKDTGHYNNMTYRRRRCLVCDYIYYTEEKVATDKYTVCVAMAKNRRCDK